MRLGKKEERREEERGEGEIREHDVNSAKKHQKRRISTAFRAAKSLPSRDRTAGLKIDRSQQEIVLFGRQCVIHYSLAPVSHHN